MRVVVLDRPTPRDVVIDVRDDRDESIGAFATSGMHYEKIRVELRALVRFGARESLRQTMTVEAARLIADRARVFCEEHGVSCDLCGCATDLTKPVILKLDTPAMAAILERAAANLTDQLVGLLDAIPEGD